MRVEPTQKLSMQSIGRRVMISGDRRELIIGDTVNGLVNLHYKGRVVVQAVPSTQCFVVL